MKTLAQLKTLEKESFLCDYIAKEIASGCNDFAAIASNALSTWQQVQEEIRVQEIREVQEQFELESLLIVEQKRQVIAQERIANLTSKLGRKLVNKHQGTLRQAQGDNVKVNRKERTDVKRILPDGTKVIGTLRNEAHNRYAKGDLSGFADILFNEHKNDSVPWSSAKSEKRAKHYFALISKGQY